MKQAAQLLGFSQFLPRTHCKFTAKCTRVSIRWHQLHFLRVARQIERHVSPFIYGARRVVNHRGSCIGKLEKSELYPRRRGISFFRTPAILVSSIARRVQLVRNLLSRRHFHIICLVFCLNDRRAALLRKHVMNWCTCRSFIMGVALAPDDALLARVCAMTGKEQNDSFTESYREVETKRGRAHQCHEAEPSARKYLWRAMRLH